MNFRSIATRVSLPGVIAVLITAGILLWVVPERQARSLTESIEGELDGAAQAVAIRVVAALELEQLNLLSDINSYLTEASGITAVAIYLGADHSNGPFAVYPEEYTDRMISGLKDGKFLFSEVDFTSDDASGSVVAVYEYEAFAARLAALNSPFYIVFFILLATQLLLYFIVTRRVIRPVQEAIDTAVKMGSTQNQAGEVSAESDAKSGTDELQQLAGVLGNLRDELFAREQDNQRLLADLESKVSERTRDLEQALSTKNEFIANVSHELRTPLHSIMASLDLIAGSIGSDQSESRGLIRIGKESSQALLELIDQLLEFQKAEVQGVRLKPEWFVIVDFFEKINRVGQIMFRDSPVSFSAEWTMNTDLSVYADEAKLMQVFNNLMSNAKKYTESGQVKVDLRCLKQGDRASLEVVLVDTGIGMSQDFLQRIDEPFSREQQSVTEPQVGTGLGIGIINRILSAFDAQLMIESTLGKGSTFSFSVQFERIRQEAPKHPRAESISEFESSTSSVKTEALREPETNHSNRVVSSPQADSEHFKFEGAGLTPNPEERENFAKDQGDKSSIDQDQDQQKPNLLYVEDTPTNRIVMKAMAAKLPIDLIMAESALEGLEIFRKGSFDLVITDIQMPDHTGLDLLEWIQQESSVPVMAFTANVDSAARTRFFEAGFIDVLTKPLNLKGLSAALEPYFKSAPEVKVKTSETLTSRS